MAGIVKYNYIAFYNADMIDKSYRNNINIILGDLYQISIRRSHFDHNNSHFNTIFQHKIQLMYVSIMCAQIGCKDNIQLVSVSLFYYCNNIKI